MSSVSVFVFPQLVCKSPFEERVLGYRWWGTRRLRHDAERPDLAPFADRFSLKDNWTSLIPSFHKGSASQSHEVFQRPPYMDFLYGRYLQNVTCTLFRAASDPASLSPFVQATPPYLGIICNTGCDQIRIPLVILSRAYLLTSAELLTFFKSFHPIFLTGICY